MKVAVLLSLLGVASAFVAPAPKMAARGRTVRMAVDDLIGADQETGGVWDPLGLSQNDEKLYKYRAVELKHGRIAMLAVLGQWVQQYYQLPDPVFENARPIAALRQVYEQRPEAIWQIIAGLSLIEVFYRQDPEKAAGDLGFGKAFYPNNEKEQKTLQLKELKNGRLAMLASMGGLMQESLSGQGSLEQLALGHYSPFGDGQGFF